MATRRSARHDESYHQVLHHLLYQRLVHYRERCRKRPGLEQVGYGLAEAFRFHIRRGLNRKTAPEVMEQRAKEFYAKMGRKAAG